MFSFRRDYSILKNQKGGKIIVIGITGKIGSGKTIVSSYIENILNNSMALDVDLIAKEIYKKEPGIIAEIKKIFGDKVISKETGTLNFSSLSKIVFSDKKELKKLNRIMFPLIRKEIRAIIEKNRDKDYIIIDAAVLFGSKLDLLCDYIILVEADHGKRRKYLEDKKFSGDEIELKMRGQHIQINRKKIDFFIKNNGNTEDLYKKVQDISDEMRR